MIYQKIFVLKLFHTPQSSLHSNKPEYHVVNAINKVTQSCSSFETSII